MSGPLLAKPVVKRDTAPRATRASDGENVLRSTVMPTVSMRCALSSAGVGARRSDAPIPRALGR